MFCLLENGIDALLILSCSGDSELLRFDCDKVCLLGFLLWEWLLPRLSVFSRASFLVLEVLSRQYYFDILICKFICGN